MVSLIVDDSVEYLLFDTGSSIFTLTTSKENALKTAGHKIEDSLLVFYRSDAGSFFPYQQAPAPYGLRAEIAQASSCDVGCRVGGGGTSAGAVGVLLQGEPIVIGG